MNMLLLGVGSCWCECCWSCFEEGMEIDEKKSKVQMVIGFLYKMLLQKTLHPIFPILWAWLLFFHLCCCCCCCCCLFVCLSICLIVWVFLCLVGLLVGWLVGWLVCLLKLFVWMIVLCVCLNVWLFVCFPMEKIPSPNFATSVNHKS